MEILNKESAIDFASTSAALLWHKRHTPSLPLPPPPSSSLLFPPLPSSSLPPPPSSSSTAADFMIHQSASRWRSESKKKGGREGGGEREKNANNGEIKAGPFPSLPDQSNITPAPSAPFHSPFHHHQYQFNIHPEVIDGLVQFFLQFRQLTAVIHLNRVNQFSQFIPEFISNWCSIHNSDSWTLLRVVQFYRFHWKTGQESSKNLQKESSKESLELKRGPQRHGHAHQDG